MNRHAPTRLRILSFVAASGLAWSGGAVAQDPVPTRGTSVEQVREQMKLVEEAADLAPEASAPILDRYRAALEQVEAADAWDEKSARLASQQETAPEHLEQLRRQLAETRIPEDQTLEKLSLAELAQGLQQKQAELTQARQGLLVFDSQIQQGPARRKQLPELIENARQQLDEEERELAADSTAPEGAVERMTATARRTERQAKIDALRAELRSHELELGSFQQATLLLAAERDLTARQISVLEAVAEHWTKASAAARTIEAQRTANEAYRALIDANPALQPLASENQVLALLRVGPEGLAAKIKRATEELKDIEAAASALDEDFARTRSRVDGIGRSKAIGFLLRHKQMGLPSTREHKKRVRQLHDEIQDVQIERVELSDERLDLVGRMMREVERTLDELGLTADHPDAAAVREILEARVRVLDELIVDYDRYFALLLDIDTRERGLISTSEEFSAFISERILWTPSDDAISRKDFSVAGEALLALVDRREWAAVADTLRIQFRDEPVRSWSLIVLLASMALAHWRWRGKIEASSTKTGPGTVPSVRPMLTALLYTILLTLFWPALVRGAGWLLTAHEDASLPAHALGAGFTGIFGTLALTLFWWNVCRPRGLGEAHFGWSSEMLTLARRNLRRILTLIVPAGFLATLFYGSTEPEWAESIGRFCLALAMPAMAWIMRDLLRPTGPLLSRYLTRREGSLLNRLRYVWYPVLVGIPLVLAVIACFGYTYTALQLAGLLIDTAGALLLAILAYQVVYRWLWIVRADIAIREARKSWQAQAEKDEQGEAASEMPESVTEPAIDLVQVNQQTLRLVRGVLVVGFLFALLSLWVEVLPAIEYLKRIELWTTDTASGPRPVTLLSLLTAVGVLFLAATATRNLSGLLEIMILARSSADRGVRFAITTLSRYTIVVVAVVVAAQALGISWGKVQWLVAAVSVGLGFGLQEIFANFVSGIVLLIERPIRVGDVVTVAGVNGWVTKIQMRATTILDYDRRELVVPNREFVTGQLINWTLTNPMTRVTIVVGVAYGSDTAEATELLLRVANENATVLEDPPPRAIFHEFGDSALNLHLFVYLPHRDVYLETIHELHTAIDAAFREAGMTIAFPQRDVHFDASGPLDVRVVTGKDAGKNVPLPERTLTDPPVSGSGRGDS